jgi:hypothetical protein
VFALVLGAMLPAAVAAGRPLPNYRPVPAPEWVTDATPHLDRLTTSGAAAAAGAATNRQDGNPDYEAGDTVVGINLNDVAGQYFLTNYEVRAIGEHIEVWVQSNPNFPEGDPRNPVVVTDEQIAYLVDQFDTNIYPKTTEFWREPELRDGTEALLPYDYVSFDGKDRVIALISNVRDEQYYDPTYPVYIAGFFSPTINLYMDRNVITIDAYDWANRVGPNDSPWRPNDGPENDRERLYEGTFAHEYQHLLHGDQNPGEESWVNEGLSDWTEYLVGYGIPAGHWDTAQEYAENSLVIWGDQGQSTEILADYGTAFMFMHYLYGLYGPEVLQAVFDNQAFGIAGVNDALPGLGIGKTFEELYHDYAVARLVLGQGEYRIPDIPSPVVLNEEAYSTPGAPPWGSDYLEIENPKKVDAISFNGVDMLVRGTAWTVVDDPMATDTPDAVLYSGAADEMDRFAIFETTGGGTLTFESLYDIEANWDFGFVQVSADGGATWETLTNANTTDVIDPNGYPKIKDQLGEGFTGLSGAGVEPEWVDEEFTLPYAGQDILVGFRMMTDWGTLGNGILDEPNWYVDDVMVDGTLISDGTDASVFNDVTFYQPISVDFTVDLVSMANYGKVGNSSAKVLHLVTDDATEVATAEEIRQALRASKTLVLVVTYDAPQGVADYVPYEVEITYR